MAADPCTCDHATVQISASMHAPRFRSAIGERVVVSARSNGVEAIMLAADPLQKANNCDSSQSRLVANPTDPGHISPEEKVGVSPLKPPARLAGDPGSLSLSVSDDALMRTPTSLASTMPSLARSATVLSSKATVRVAGVFVATAGDGIGSVTMVLSSLDCVELAVIRPLLCPPACDG